MVFVAPVEIHQFLPGVSGSYLWLKARYSGQHRPSYVNSRPHRAGANVNHEEKFVMKLIKSLALPVIAASLSLPAVAQEKIVIGQSVPLSD